MDEQPPEYRQEEAKLESSELEITGAKKKKKSKKKKEKKEEVKKEADNIDGYQIESSEIISVLTSHINDLSAIIFEDK